MSRKPEKYCAVPSCPNIVEAGKTYCDFHEKQRHKRINAKRESATKQGYDRTWRRLRLLVLHSEPLCRECKKHGRLTAATEVDHIIPLSKGGTNELNNLQPLCHECHSRKTASEDGGFGRERGDTQEG